MDDGCNQGVLATNGFTEFEVDLLQMWLKKKWNITANKRSSRNYFILKIASESRLDFDKLISPYIIPSMQYKLKYIFALSV